MRPTRTYRSLWGEIAHISFFYPSMLSTYQPASHMPTTGAFAGIIATQCRKWLTVAVVSLSKCLSYTGKVLFHLPNFAVVTGVLAQTVR
jgi:hypothetical protein